MLTMTNPLLIEGVTVYHDDADEIQALGGAPVAGGSTRRFYVLPETPTIAKDPNGKPIFSLIVYRREEDRIDPARAAEDVGGGILTFTVELGIPDEKFKKIKSRLRTRVFGDDASDPSQDVDVAYVPFLDGKVAVAVAAETGAEEGEFLQSAPVGNGKISGIGANRKAVMVKLTQRGAALMSQIDQLSTLPINVQYELSFEHRLLGVSMRVWCDMNSSYELIQTVIHETDEYRDGYLAMSKNHVRIDKITSVTETMVRNKTAGVTVVPASSQVSEDTLLSLEKFGFDMLNKEMEKMLQASPPPETIDRTYLEEYVSQFNNNFNFSLDRRMVLVKSFNPSANVSNVFQQGNLDEMVAFVDLRIGFFTFLKVPIRVNADFSKLPLDSVTVTVKYERERIGGTGREERIDSFNFTDGSSVQTFLAYANKLEDVTYDWWATVHYKGSQESFTFERNRVQDDFLVVDVGSLGMLSVDMGLGLVDLEKFPAAKASVRYHSRKLNRTLEQSFRLSKQQESVTWTEVIHEAPQAYEYKIDWLRKDGDILEGEWISSTSSRLRFDAPVPDQLAVDLLCTGEFAQGNNQISQVAVSLRYRDEENDYIEEGRLVFTDDKQRQTWTVDLRNRELRDYEYKYSIVYKGGVVKEFPEDGGWYPGEPGFITVGEKYTLQVDVFPTLMTYPDHAKLVKIDFTYDDPETGIHQVDSFVFSKEASAARPWRVRGTQRGTKRYKYQVTYFGAAPGVVSVMPPVVSESEALIVPAAPAPAAPIA